MNPNQPPPEQEPPEQEPPGRPPVERLERLIDQAARHDRDMAVSAAARTVAIDQARIVSESLTTVPVTATLSEQRRANLRVLVLELAFALHVPERTMQTMIAHAETLVHTLPNTLATLAAGEISYRHATVLADNTYALTPENVTALEAAVLPGAGELTVSKFAQKVRRIRERLDASTITARHQRSAADRAVFFEPAPDGMCWLSAFLPASTGRAIFTRLTGAAKKLHAKKLHTKKLQRPTEPRTITQIKADLFTDLGLAQPNRCGRGKGKGKITPDVAIMVPALTLLGRGDEPAILEGYGPIDIDTAKELVGRATSFIRILTHPETGAILSVGRTRYKPPKDLKTVLRIRDGSCRAPGCNRAPVHCDIDHTVPFTAYGQHGETCLTNLAHLCPKHHADKHDYGSQLTQNTSGTVSWTTPTGRAYSTHPDNHIDPAPEPPPGPDAGPRNGDADPRPGRGGGGSSPPAGRAHPRVEPTRGSSPPAGRACRDPTGFRQAQSAQRTSRARVARCGRDHTADRAHPRVEPVETSPDFDTPIRALCEPRPGRGG